MLKGEPLAIEKVLEFMSPLALALDYAHGEGIIHRDLKSANVLLDQDGRTILADFSLALMLQNATRFTQAQQAIGTPEYMSPEQAYRTVADHRSDLYSFGIMIYQILLGDTSSGPIRRRRR
jgi:serine/threonine-protein kinase PpkA